MQRSLGGFMFVAGAILLSGIASADQRIQLPEGRGCWINNVGYAYGCDPAPQRSSNGGSTSSQPRCGWPTKKEWKSCERTKDMPGQPSNCDHLLPKC